MTWFCDVFTTIKQYFFFVDQIMFPEFVLLLYIYIMHVQSCIVYKWMTVLILLIKDIKVEQLNVLQVTFFLKKNFSVEHCNEFSLSFKNRKTCIHALLAHKFQRNQNIFIRCLNTYLYIKQEKTFFFYREKEYLWKSINQTKPHMKLGITKIKLIF